ncbi:MAG: amphi-Trp domain-containing protein [Peptococcaceae bacterium]|nr:amphi-Trp domain-containing protein [Peptococcaceae bacterium]
MSAKKKQVLFSSEESRSIAEIGDFLIQAGQNLKNKGFFNLIQGDRKIGIRPSEATKLELRYEVKNEARYSFEIEIEWRPGSGNAADKVGIS